MALNILLLLSFSLGLFACVELSLGVCLCVRFTFYDGPPFATGLPHYGHILAGTIKDIVTRFAHQNGFYVERRFGWDCHGLPVVRITRLMTSFIRFSFKLMRFYITLSFSRRFYPNDLQMRTIEAIKTNKRAMSYDKSQLA